MPRSPRPCRTGRRREIGPTGGGSRRCRLPRRSGSCRGRRGYWATCLRLQKPRVKPRAGLSPAQSGESEVRRGENLNWLGEGPGLLLGRDEPDPDRIPDEAWDVVDVELLHEGRPVRLDGLDA